MFLKINFCKEFLITFIRLNYVGIYYLNLNKTFKNEKNNHIYLLIL